MSVTVNKTRLPQTEWKTASGSIVSVDDARMRDAKSLIVRIDPVQEGSGDPSPDNERPITGWTGIKLYNDPKYGGLVKWNQLFHDPEDWDAHSVQTRVTIAADGVITATLVSGNPTVFSPAIDPVQTNVSLTTIADHKYALACKFKPATDGFPYLRNNTAFNVASVFGIQATPAGEWGDYRNIISATDTGGPAWYLGQGGKTSSITIGDSFSIKDMMCVDLTDAFGAGNEPSSIEAFLSIFPKDSYPYNAGEEMTVSEVNGDPFQALSITVPSDVGTVYSARWDLITGEMVVDRAMKIFTGASGENWYTYDPSNYNSFCFVVDQPDKRIKAMTSICNRFANVNAAWSAGGNDKYGVFSDHVNLARWYFRQPGPDIDTIQKWREWLSENPLQVCYELAAPIVYNVAPNRVPMFHKSNNIWANAGPVEVTYAAIKDHQQ